MVSRVSRRDSWPRHRGATSPCHHRLHALFTTVYTCPVEDCFRFDERSYDALAAAGIRWQDVLEVLRARPRVRHHIGAALRIAAQTSAGAWLAVAALEEDDDEYLVVGARELDEAEVAAVRAKMIQGDV